MKKYVVFIICMFMIAVSPVIAATAVTSCTYSPSSNSKNDNQYGDITGFTIYSEVEDGETKLLLSYKYKGKNTVYEANAYPIVFGELNDGVEIYSHIKVDNFIADMENGKCDDIFIFNNGELQINNTGCENTVDGNEPVCYEYTSSSSTTTKGQNVNYSDVKCRADNSKTCRTFKNTDESRVYPAYIEIGTTTDNKYYLYVSTDDGGEGGKTGVQEDGYLETYAGSYNYTISSEAADEIFTKDSDGNVSYSDIEVIEFPDSKLYKIFKKGSSLADEEEGFETDGTYEYNADTYVSTYGGKGTAPVLDLNIDESVTFCEGKTLRAIQIVGYILYIIKIVVPAILVIMGSVDLAKGVISTGEKANKESLNAFIRRIIIAVVIFLIPTLLDFVISLIEGASDAWSNYQDCTNCLLDPLGNDCKNNSEDLNSDE